MEIKGFKHMQNSKRFYSKKDIGLGMVIWIPLIASLFSLGFGVVINNKLHLLPSFIIILFINLFFAYLWFGTYYIFRESYLYVRCGPFRGRISYDKIIALKESHDPSSAAACSLKRIEIRYGKYDTALVSPKKRNEFINEIKDRCNCLIELEEIIK